MVHVTYRTPQIILDELRIRTPDEINIKVISFHCGAIVEEEALTGCEARLIGYEDRAIITVNTHSSLARRRFSAAHELGHWLKDRGMIASATCSEDSMNEWQDRESHRETAANRFAADLLMPNPMFHPLAKNRPITMETVRYLADIFHASVTATAIRLVEAGSMPGMVICTGPSGRLWFVMGSEVPRKLFPLRRPGAGSIAYDLLNGRGGAFENMSVDADNWIDHPDAGEYQVIENSILIARNTILTLLWWKDERQILDIDRDDE
jgi:hypothetical protein